MPSGNDSTENTLKLCLKQIELKLQWLDASTWKSVHYDLLSDKILEETKIRLSPVTLKRLWGKVDYNSSPSRSTLDTLANFLGYSNWVEYERQHTTHKKSRVTTSFLPNISGSFGKYTMFLGIGLVVLIILLASLPRSKAQKTYGPTSFDFEPVAQGLPNTVAFKYEATASKADSVFIQQSWNPKLRHKVDKTKGFFASTYYYPGFYKAKLVLDTTIAEEKNLLIPSDGWLGTIEDGKIPVYLGENDMNNNDGELKITPENLVAKGITLEKKIPRVKIHLVKDFGHLEGNGLDVSTVFKSTWNKGNAVCQNMEVLLLGSEAPIIIPFSIKGCTGKLNMYLAGESLDGENTDLTGFGVDFAQWVHLKVGLGDENLTIKINDKTVYQRPLQYPLGKLVGVRYQFHGPGTIKSLAINTNGKTIYQSNF